jgi:hypothetical protein
MKGQALQRSASGLFVLALPVLTTGRFAISQDTPPTLAAPSEQ